MPDKNVNAELAENIGSLGISLLEAGRLCEAALLLRKATLIAPQYTDAALCLGHCLHLQGKYLEALEAYDQLLNASPGVAAAWNNRGTTLLALCRYDEAAASYIHALEFMPEWFDTLVALATCYQALGRTIEAESICDMVIAAVPDHAEAHWNRALLLLLRGEYREGWHEYEWRWQRRNFTSPRRDFPQPLWQGEPLSGKSILIHAEQGFGDTLQFCRYVPLVTNMGARVIFECQSPLVELMKSIADNLKVIQIGDSLPPFDMYVPLLSLAGIFNTTVDKVPGTVPYLSPPVDRLPFWQGLILNDNYFKVGLCWAGKSYPDPGRSCPESLLEPLSEVAGISWYSLQVGRDRPLPLPMTDFTGTIRDFNDTAALISQLDLVITIDTAVAHLAGALGKPTWILLPFAPDWRWMTDREDSPWYPTVRVFRQKQAGAWNEVVGRVAAALQGRL